ncbi:hypothetical protein [Streptomyces fagopyri]
MPTAYRRLASSGFEPTLAAYDASCPVRRLVPALTAYGPRASA